MLMPSSLRRFMTQLSYAAAVAMARYSASVVKCVTVFCFLELQLIGLGPRKRIYPDVDVLSSKFPAQLASAKAWRWRRECLRKKMPWLIVPWRYRNIRLTADQCIVDGRCINWDNLLTANEISGRVRDKYCKEPRTWCYWIGSIAGLPSHSLSDSPVDKGVVTAFASCMFVLDNRSWIYFRCDRKSPEDVYVASTPKK